MTSSNIRSEGIANEIVMARVNIEVFEEIRKNWDKIKTLNEHERQLFNYLKISSINQSILHLGRLFDRPNKKYPTFCLEALFDAIDSENLPLQNHILTKRQWADFTQKFQHLFVSFSELKNQNPKSFFFSIRNFINKAFDKEVDDDFILKRLKNWRDKKVAHSEKYDFGNFISFEEAKILLDISKATSEFVNIFLQSDLIIIAPGGDSIFINELIEKYCG